VTAPDIRHPLDQALGRIAVETHGEGLTDITRLVAGWLARHRCRDGMLTLFVRHTSASLTIQENADPDVRTDLVTALRRLAPQDGPWVHTTEGPDDMPAHVRTMLTGVNLAVPVEAGAMMLGTWQGIYIFEHRSHPHRREIALHYLGTIGDQS
jgi:secondary thiamine-phosphate synthase enzyme